MVQKQRTTRTAQQKERFIGELSRLGHVGEAAKSVSVGRRTVYQWREADEDFDTAWRIALDVYIESLEAEADRRGKKGVLKSVYQGGKKVGSVRTYSDVLLIFRLKALRPDIYRERQSVEHTGARGGPIEHNHALDLSKLSDTELTQLRSIREKMGANADSGD